MQTFLEQKYVIIIFLAFFIITGFFIVHTFSSGYPDFNRIEGADIAAEKKYWSTRMDKIGPTRAYEEFLKMNNNTGGDTQHFGAHIIGEALYEHEGSDGIAVCTSDFGFGCFHGFFGIGLAIEGLSFVARADAKCVEQFGPLGTGCQHGIGHGILEYTGYGRLNDALRVCDETTQLVSVLGCTSGVFMEYNTPFITLPGDVRALPLPFTQDAPYGACERVSEVYKESCYYELGQWWSQVLAHDVARMGALCSAISDATSRTSCILGVGNIIGPVSKYRVADAKSACDLMGEEVRVLCRAGVGWSMYANPPYRERAPEMCEDLLEEDFQICTTYRDLTRNVFN